MNKKGTLAFVITLCVIPGAIPVAMVALLAKLQQNERRNNTGGHARAIRVRKK